MANILKTGSQWLHSKRKAYESESGTYSRAASTATILFTKRKTDFQIVDGDSQIPVEGRLDDFVIHAADLIIGGSVVKPQRGDKITLGGIVYEVLNDSEGKCWRYEDQYNEELRIHTKRI